MEHVEREAGGVGMSPGSGTNNFKVEGSIDYHKWVMKNVPALKEERFTTTLGNAIAKIEFQLNQVVFPNSLPRYYMDSWEKVASDLMEDEEFGVPINRPNNWLDNDVKDMVKNATTQHQRHKKYLNMSGIILPAMKIMESILLQVLRMYLKIKMVRLQISICC